MEYKVKNGFGVPEVEVLSTTDNVLKAWLLSKPNIKYNSKEEAKAEINKLITANLPISGFKVYCLSIYSSIYFRDLLFCMPHIVPWSQSTRNLEMTSPIYQISKECEGLEFADKHRAILDNCRKRSAAGEALDRIKLDLPCTTMMAYSLFIDRRTLLTFAKTLEYLDRDLFEIYGRLLLNAVGISDEEYRNTKVSHIYDKLKVTDHQLKLFENKERGSEVEFLDDYALHTVKINFGIAAQFIRQHFSLRRYYEFNRIKDLGYFKCLNHDLNARTIVSTMGEKFSFMRTISRRLCWFAAFDVNDEHDSWAVILDDFMTKIKDQKEFEELLPCKGCSDNCDIFEEFKLRAKKLGDPNLKDGLTSADRNEICPILRDKLCPNRSISDIFKSREESQGSNSETFRMWKEIYGTESEKSILSELFGI